MRRIVLTGMLVLLSACTTISYDLGDLAGPGPRFGDHDPHVWKGRAPWSYAVHGTDVAKYQNAVDWRRLKANHIAFAFIKATEGGDRVDERFAENWREARQVGIPRGAYHFYYFCRSAADQAAWFISHVPNDPSALPPVLDIEWNPTSPTCRLRPPAATVRREMVVFLNALASHYGKTPIVYTTVDFFQDNDLSTFKNVRFWLRSVAGHPDEKYSGLPWIFWQYTGTGEVRGIGGDADLNAFNGSKSDWQKWLEANTG